MAKITPEKIEAAHTVLKKTKVFTLPQLVAMLECSSRTAQTKLQQWQVYNSYNHNGRYYALPNVPRFDEHGRWQYQQIFFSRHGTLKNTVVQLVRQASAGLTGQQIGELVQLSPRSFLHHFRDTPGLRREKHGGVYVYFAADPDSYAQQRENRLAELAREAGPLSDAEAVLILAALIKHCGLTAEQLAALPEVQARKISPLVIGEFLARHGLLKKTPAIRR